jgi:hypothetical protein
LAVSVKVVIRPVKQLLQHKSNAAIVFQLMRCSVVAILYSRTHVYLIRCVRSFKMLLAAPAHLKYYTFLAVFLVAIICYSNSFAVEGGASFPAGEPVSDDADQEGASGAVVKPAPENPPSAEDASVTGQPQNNYKTRVVLQGLNKITARTSKLEVGLEQPIKFGNLIVTLHACWKSPPEELPESKAMLEMWEEIPGEVRRKIFSGWMFASSPLLSAPEHPIYDITVIECAGEPLVQTDGVVKKGLPVQ